MGLIDIFFFTWLEAISYHKVWIWAPQAFPLKEHGSAQFSSPLQSGLLGYFDEMRCFWGCFYAQQESR